MLARWGYYSGFGRPLIVISPGYGHHHHIIIIFVVVIIL